LANSFWDHVIQISIRQMDFKYIFPKYEKLEFFVETFAPYNQILIFQEKAMYIQYVFYIFDTDHCAYNFSFILVLLISSKLVP
jgi:hypothetical protein